MPLLSSCPLLHLTMTTLSWPPLDLAQAAGPHLDHWWMSQAMQLLPCPLLQAKVETCLHSVSVIPCCPLLVLLVATCGNGCSVCEMMALGCLVCTWGLAVLVSLLPEMLVGFLVPPLLRLLRQCPYPYSLGQLLVLRRSLVLF